MTSSSGEAHRRAHAPGGWRAADLERRGGWERPFRPEEIDALIAAVRRLARGGRTPDLAGVGAADFPLGPMAATVEQLRSGLIDGPGVQVLTGFPVERCSEAELRLLWWGLACHLGTPVAQSHRGDLIGDVRDLGTGIDGRAGRGYTSNSELGFHADAADVSGLFLLRTARSGGVNRIASSLAVHDELARRRPDLLAVLYQPFAWSWQGNEPPGAPAWYSLPVFGRAGDDVACAFVRTNIVRAEANAGAPPMTDLQREAVDLLAAVAAEPGMWVERTFAPGTMWFVDNQTVLHMRTEFVDGDEPESRRHLLRIWLSLPNTRRLPDSFAPFFGDVRAGAVRGGYPSRAARPTFTTG
jgi:hypothetical protein